MYLLTLDEKPGTYFAAKEFKDEGYVFPRYNKEYSALTLEEKTTVVVQDAIAQNTLSVFTREFANKAAINVRMAPPAFLLVSQDTFPRVLAVEELLPHSAVPQLEG